MYAFRLEQMGNADAESTVAPLPATLRKIRASGEEPTWSGFLRADLDQALTSKDDGRITFRQVGKSSSSGYSWKRRRCSRASVLYLNTGRRAKRQFFILVDDVSRSRQLGEMVGVHKNTEGLRVPEFAGRLGAIARYLSRDAVRELQEPMSQRHAGLLAAGRPKRGNSSPRQCRGRR